MTWLLVGAIVYAIANLALMGWGLAAVINLAQLQRAIARHRASAGTWDDDCTLYREASFDPPMPAFRPPPERFLRGKGQRG